MGEYIWRNTFGGIHLGEYIWGNTFGGIHLGEYIWGSYIIVEVILTQTKQLQKYIGIDGEARNGHKETYKLPDFLS